MADAQNKVTTLNQFVIEKQAEFPGAHGELTRLLHHIGIAAKKVHKQINKAGLADILGGMGSYNVQQEAQQKLDVLSDKLFIDELYVSGECVGVASEENDDVIIFGKRHSPEGKYIICIDPLDGSSNIDANVSVGTIFSIYRRKSPIGSEVTLEDFLQPGTEQVAAGYVIYGSSTMLVYTTGYGVNGFTLDTSIGEFCLSHPLLKAPKTGKIYSVNEGNYLYFPDGVKKYIKYCQEIDSTTNRPYTMRYIGSLVADFHRNLLLGGIFIYPPTKSNPKGKLRLIYEANPIAFIAEQAGASASNGTSRILEMKPNELHQRVPFYVGSEEMVDKIVEFLD